ncbi:hypothetical protein CK203_069509 [Vitis vinifera]|uniref:Uncharacterized protein n=1 Tax=Vitis vinifera TaxID=29760 RepID=A0A438EKG3_VITVI|nr:hypothetical protein CK203_069509 [Vitis vinifera]
MVNPRIGRNLLTKVEINRVTLIANEEIKDGVCRAYHTLLLYMGLEIEHKGLHFKVLEEDRSKSLKVSFLEEEVFEALSSLSGDKAPSPNGTIPDLLLKMDIEKAYDHVDWDFLLRLWGLRQGDPISPYLFIFAIEAHSQFLFKAKSGSFISRFKVGRSSGKWMNVSHLLFVNNTLILYGTNNDQLRYLSWVFMWFEVVFGLIVNMDKSEVVLVREVEIVENVVSVLGCKVGKLPLPTWVCWKTLDCSIPKP